MRTRPSPTPPSFEPSPYLEVVLFRVVGADLDDLATDFGPGNEWRLLLHDVLALHCEHVRERESTALNLGGWGCGVRGGAPVSGETSRVETNVETNVGDSP